MKHALIFGGAGFVGSHLVDALTKAEYSIEVFDDLSTGRVSFLTSNRQMAMVVGDIRCHRDYAGISQRAPTVVYHLAAVHHIPTCEREAIRTLETNVVGTQRVLEHAASRGTPRVIFASSGAVYDDRQDGPLHEGTPLHATNLYASTKLTGEYLVQRTCEQYDIESVVARLFNVVGPRETNAHLLPDLVTQLRTGADTVVVGNTTPRRDYVHVRDVARALVSLADCSLDATTEAFNIGSGVEHPVSDVIAELGRIAGVDLRVDSDDRRCRRNDRPSQLSDCTKLRTRTGWRPNLSLHDALVDIWNDHQAAA